MKRRLCIVIGVVLVLVSLGGIAWWQDVQAENRQLAKMPELRNILIRAENRGAEWATDELMINGVDKNSEREILYRKWGEPAESGAVADGITEDGINADVWVLSEEFCLVVEYDSEGRSRSMKVMSYK